jgi:ABC-2 type transport system ATP-binding protein
MADKKSKAHTVIKATGLCKTFVVGFIPVAQLAKRDAGEVRPELDQKVLPRQVEAVRELSFEVQAGEIFGLLGPNGSGKTTTIKMMMGLIFPTAGKIELFGETVPNVAVKRRVGYLPENPTFYDYLRADEFLEFSARLCGVDKKTRRARIPELLERVGLSEALNRPLRKFSKGMLQRIGLAQALIHDPDLVVLDEPLSGLDPLGRKDVRDLISELRSQGKTVIFSSHILSDVEMICDRVGIVVRGELRDIGKLDDLLSARVTETEVVLEKAPASVVDLARDLGWSALQKGDRLRILLPGETDPEELLRKALDDGAQIISVVPLTESLEDLFVREARKA